MASILPSSLQRFINRVQQVPGGFKKLFFETKDVLFLLRKRSQTKLTRRETELVRHNIDSLKKVGVYFFLQLPPIIGMIPVSHCYSLAFYFILLNTVTIYIFVIDNSVPKLSKTTSFSSFLQ